MGRPTRYPTARRPRAYRPRSVHPRRSCDALSRRREHELSVPVLDQPLDETAHPPHRWRDIPRIAAGVLVDLHQERKPDLTERPQLVEDERLRGDPDLPALVLDAGFEGLFRPLAHNLLYLLGSHERRRIFRFHRLYGAMLVIVGTLLLVPLLGDLRHLYLFAQLTLRFEPVQPVGREAYHIALYDHDPGPLQPDQQPLAALLRLLPPHKVPRPASGDRSQLSQRKRPAGAIQGVQQVSAALAHPFHALAGLRRTGQLAQPVIADHLLRGLPLGPGPHHTGDARG